MGEFPAEEEEEVELLRSRVAFAADESMLRVCVIWVYVGAGDRTGCFTGYNCVDSMFRGNSDVMFHAKDQLVLERGYKTLYIRHRCTRRMVCKERKCQLIIRLFFS